MSPLLYQLSYAAVSCFFHAKAYAILPDFSSLSSGLSFGVFSDPVTSAIRSVFGPATSVTRDGPRLTSFRASRLPYPRPPP